MTRLLVKAHHALLTDPGRLGDDPVEALAGIDAGRRFEGLLCRAIIVFFQAVLFAIPLLGLLIMAGYA